MIISLIVKFQKFIENQKKILNEFNEELNQNNSPEKSVFSKVKDFWDGLT